MRQRRREPSRYFGCEIRARSTFQKVRRTAVRRRGLGRSGRNMMCSVYGRPHWTTYQAMSASATVLLRVRVIWVGEVSARVAVATPMMSSAV